MEIEVEDESILERTQLIMQKILRAQGISTDSTVSTTTTFPQESSPELNFKQNRFEFLNLFNIGSNDPSTNESTSDQMALIQQQQQKQQKQQQQQQQQYQQQECGFVPLYFNIIMPDSNTFFIYGGLQLDFNYKINDDTPLRKVIRSYSRVEYFKKDGLLVYYNEQQRPSIKDITPIIQRAQSMNDESYYALSLAMIEYQKRLPIYMKVNSEYCQQLLQQQNEAKFEYNYKKFEEWAMQELRKMNSSDFFAFQIIRLNYHTEEFEVKVSGQSQGLMALRGADITDPALFTLRKDNFHYFDGDSNLIFLKSQFSGSNSDAEEAAKNKRIISFDELKIEVTHFCNHFTNRDADYPFLSEQLPQTHLRFEFMLGIASYEVPKSVLELIVKIRKQRSQFDASLLEDFTYTAESQIFFDRYYANPNQRIKVGRNVKPMSCTTQKLSCSDE